MPLLKSCFVRWAGEGRIYRMDTPFSKELLLAVISSSDSGYCHGQITIYAAPRALLKHLEVGLGQVLNQEICLHWRIQGLKPGSYVSRLSYSAKVGKAAEIVILLKSWNYLIFEVSEFNSLESSLYLYTKELGLYRGAINDAGQILVSEDQLRKVIDENINQGDLQLAIEKLLAEPWEIALQPFRKLEIDGFDNLGDRLLV